MIELSKKYRTRDSKEVRIYALDGGRHMLFDISDWVLEMEDGYTPIAGMIEITRTEFNKLKEGEEL